MCAIGDSICTQHSMWAVCVKVDSLCAQHGTLSGQCMLKGTVPVLSTASGQCVLKWTVHGTESEQSMSCLSVKQWTVGSVQFGSCICMLLD